MLLRRAIPGRRTVADVLVQTIAHDVGLEPPATGHRPKGVLELGFGGRAAETEHVVIVTLRHGADRYPSSSSSVLVTATGRAGITPRPARLDASQMIRPTSCGRRRPPRTRRRPRLRHRRRWRGVVAATGLAGRGLRLVHGLAQLHRGLGQRVGAALDRVGVLAVEHALEVGHRLLDRRLVARPPPCRRTP